MNNNLGITKSEWKALLKIATPDSIRNYGTVIYFDTDRVVATDGFRLAYIETKIPEPLHGVSIPAKAIKTALTFMDRSGFDIAVINEVGSYYQWIEIGYAFLLRFKRSPVTFPKYKNLLPSKKPSEKFDLSLSEFKTEVASRLADSDKSKAVKLPLVENNIPMVNGVYLMDSLSLTKPSSISIFKKGDPIEIHNGRIVTIIVPIDEVK